MTVRVGTFCSGIAAPELAWSALGWEPQWFSEIDPFACAVLAHHYPGVPNLGDMEAIRGEDLRGTVDVVCAGTPCQSFSVAGLRGGMADARGNLALVFLGLVDAIRPRWVVWENVPGVLSSDGGRDFGSFLGGLAKLGYGFAYRVLDAQHFGIPQRRRRVFVVGHLGDWRRAAAVLFERHSLSGNPAPCREAGTRVAAGLTRGADSSGAGGYAGRRREDDYNLIGVTNFGERDTSTCVTSHGQRLDPDTETFIVHSLRADGFDASEDGTGRGTPLVPVQCNGTNVGIELPSLRRGNGHLTGGVPAVAYRDDRGRGNDRAIENQAYPLHAAKGQSEQQVVAYVNPRIIRNSTTSNQIGIKDGSASDTLSTDGPGAVAFAQNQRDELRTMDVAGALAGEPGMKQQTYIAFQERGREGGRAVEWQEDIAYAQQSRSGGGATDRFNIAAGMAVRRLTPRECERLQGFPDDYTRIPFRKLLNKLNIPADPANPNHWAKDGPRYRALGNSMAVPVLRWISERIEQVEEMGGVTC